MIRSTSPFTVEQVARHYDELDEFYREVWGEHVHHGLWRTGRESAETATENLSLAVAEAAGIQTGDRVCDIGCGYGATSRLIAQQFQATVTGFTVSESQYQFACSQSPEGNPNFQLRRWEENGLADESMDRAVSIECVSHIEDKPQYFSEIARVLRPGGRAAFTAWLAGPSPSPRQERHLLEPICREGRLGGMATTDEYRDLIAEAGLQFVACEELSRQVRRTWWICARRFAWRVATRWKYVAALLDRSKDNRVFAVTLFRILAAYYCGAMQYGLFEIEKPA